MTKAVFSSSARGEETVRFLTIGEKSSSDALDELCFKCHAEIARARVAVKDGSPERADRLLRILASKMAAEIRKIKRSEQFSRTRAPVTGGEKDGMISQEHALSEKEIDRDRIHFGETRPLYRS